MLLEEEKNVPPSVHHPPPIELFCTLESIVCPNHTYDHNEKDFNLANLIQEHVSTLNAEFTHSTEVRFIFDCVIFYGHPTAKEDLKILSEVKYSEFAIRRRRKIAQSDL